MDQGPDVPLLSSGQKEPLGQLGSRCWCRVPAEDLLMPSLGLVLAGLQLHSPLA